MKTVSVKKIVLSMAISAFVVWSVTAQIATPEGQIQGGNSKDTGHFVDRPTMHVHEETTVIEKKKKEHGKGVSAESNATPKSDTAQQAQQTPATSTDTMGNINVLNETNGGSSTMNSTDQNTTQTVNQSMNPIYTALTIFGVGALLGLLLLVMILRNQKTSRLMALMHGALGLVGIGILITYCMFFSGLLVSIVILAIAATGGIIVFYKDISGESIPKWLVVTHGVVALIGVITLVMYAVAK